MKIGKYILVILLFFLTAICVEGQQLFDDSNSSPMTIGNPASNAEIDVNAIVNNPACAAFLRNGLTVASGVAFRFQMIDSENYYSLNGCSISRSCDIYSHKTSPSLQVVYKKRCKDGFVRDWAILGAFLNGGGMGRQYGNGCVAFDQSLNQNADENLMEQIGQVLRNYETYAEIFGNIYGVDAPAFGENDFLMLNSSDYSSTSDCYRYMLGGAVRFKQVPSLSLSLGIGYRTLSIKGKTTPVFVFFNPDETTDYSIAEYEQQFVDFYDTLLTVYPNNFLFQTFKDYHQNVSDLFVSISDTSLYVMNQKLNQLSIALGADYLVSKWNISGKVEWFMGNQWNVKFGVSYYYNYHWKFGAGIDISSNPYNHIYSTIKNKRSTETNVSLSCSWMPNERVSLCLGGCVGYNDIVILCGRNNVDFSRNRELKFVSFTDYGMPTWKLAGFFSYNFTNNLTGMLGANVRGLWNNTAADPNTISNSNARYRIKPECNLSIGITSHF